MQNLVKFFFKYISKLYLLLLYLFLKMFSGCSIKEPKKKKQTNLQKETIFLPLPIPIQCPNDKNVYNFLVLFIGT